MIKKLFSSPSTVTPPTSLGVFIAPNDYYENVPNGAYTTPFFYGSAVGGTGPYTYQWTIDNGVILTPTAEKTKIQLSGSRREVNALLRLTVTDDLGATATSQPVTILIQFGTPQ